MLPKGWFDKGEKPIKGIDYSMGVDEVADEYAICVMRKGGHIIYLNSTPDYQFHCNEIKRLADYYSIPDYRILKEKT